MKPKDFYFELCRQISGYYFLITPVSFYDKEGICSNEPGIADSVLPGGFHELSPSKYQYEGFLVIGRRLLLDLGMQEINFGLQLGETQKRICDENNDDELDMLLKDNPAGLNQFDYKNISTDKLMRHMKIMVNTDAFEEAAKIRDELKSRGLIFLSQK